MLSLKIIFAHAANQLFLNENAEIALCVFRKEQAFSESFLNGPPILSVDI